MNSSLKNKWWWVIAVAGFLAVNYLASLFHTRIDLTHEKRFTISEPVKDVLKNIDEPAEVLVFLKGDLPSGFKKLAATSLETLQEFKDYSRGKIHYKLISAEDVMPGSGITYADTLTSLGIIPINLKIQLKAGEQSQYVYPAALVNYKGKLQAVNLYTGTKAIITPPELNSAEALLEYKFADALLKMINPHRPLIAYATGHGEPTGINTYDLVENVLKKDYELFTVNLAQEPVIPDTFKALIMVKPTLAFSDDEKLKIDQYVMRGGNLILFIDRLEAEMDSLQIKNQVIAYDRNLQLNDLLFRYGARINPDLLMDLQCDFLPFSVNNQDQYEFLHWNYFPLFESSQNSVINKNLGLVSGKFVNTIDTVAAPGITKTILLKSSDNSRSISTPALISGTENRNAPVDAQFNQKGLFTGVLLEGKFPSLYKNRISRSKMDTLQNFGTPFLGDGIKNSKIILVSDGDIVLNGVMQGNPIPMGVNHYTIGSQYEYQFANRQFVENALEYIVDEGKLSEARGKDYQLRLLDIKKINADRHFWQIINLSIPIILILIFGFTYQWIRKRKYVKIAP
ncbi:MAG: gliding motility-associated ABC transporter substrate-binding protein GldG [Ginsengibacter sp.]